MTDVPTVDELKEFFWIADNGREGFLPLHLFETKFDTSDEGYASDIVSGAFPGFALNVVDVERRRDIESIYPEDPCYPDDSYDDAEALCSVYGGEPWDM